MLILRTEGEPVSGTPASAFFLASGITTVGRQVGHSTNLALTQDLSISRKHAEINIGPLDVHSAPGSVPSFQLKDLSRFGCLLNGSAVGSGNTCAVKPGDVIQFGHKTKLRVSWDRVVLCLPDEDAATQQQAAALGFFCRRSWDATCTHLVRGQASGLTAVAACASAAGKPILHTDWLGACMQASTAEVKEMPPPCDSFLLSVVLPRDVADRLPPTDARGAAPTAVHAPLRDWTVVWHPGTEEPQLQQAAALAGGRNTAAGDPALAAAAGGRLLHVVPDSSAAQAVAHQPTITARCLMAAIIDGRPAALQALLVPDQPEPAAKPAGPKWIQSPKKRAAGAALAGRAEKKPRRGRGRSPQADAAEDAEDAIFDPGNDAASPRQDAEAQPMKIEHTVVVADIISTPPQPQQPETPNAIGSGSPNFKRFRKQLSSEGRRPLIPFAAASYAQEVGAQDFIRAEKQAQKQNNAADELFAAKLKVNKAKARK